MSLIDPAGKTTPAQFLYAEHYNDGGLKRARLAFIAHEVPALGYATYRIIPGKTVTDQGASVSKPENGDSIENEHYRATFNLATGEMTRLLDKELQWEALAGPGNVVARQQDKGDLWELYRGLDGGSHVAMTNQQAVPTAGTALLSSGEKGTNGTARSGPVLSEFNVEHPFGNGSFATRVRLYAGVRRIDIRTELVNNEKYVRYQVLFPAAIQGGHNVQEIPFGALERPVAIEFPAQHWVDYSDGKQGVALLNVGVPGNLVTDGVLMLSLMRAHNLGAYGFGGGYEPGMSSETGFELGQRRFFQYALVPHEGDWRQAEVYRAGLELNHPLLVRKTTVHAGSLPNRWSLIGISAPNVVLTALKPGVEEFTVLRVYEASGQTTPGVRIRLHAPIASVHEANLLEDSGRKLRVQNNSVVFDLHPFEIKTIKLQFKGKR